MKNSIVCLGRVAALLLAGCAAPSGPSSFGSPERTAHALACLPYVLGAASQAAGAKGADTAQVLTALDAKVQSGEGAAAAAACGPYLADLVLDGNSQAKALKAAVDARATP